MPGNRAISDSMGIMLVAAAVLSTVAVGGIGVIEYQKAQAPTDPNAAISASVNGTNLTVTHMGGESIPRANADLVTQGATVEEFDGRHAVEVRGDGDGLFEPGERWRWSASDSFADDVTVMLVKQETGAVVDTAAMRPPPAAEETIENLAPNPDIDAPTLTPDLGQSIELDAAASRDPDGTISSYAWDIDGDGDYESTGKTAEVSFTTPGDVTVTLRVTDNEGKTSKTSKTLTIDNQDPSVSIESSCEGVDCTFTADAFDPDGSIESVEWSFGDGTTATGATVSHSYDEPGTYDVSVTVTDDGGATATASTSVTVAGDLEFVSGEAVPTDLNGKKTAVTMTLRNLRGQDVTIVGVSVTTSMSTVDGVYEDDVGSDPFAAEFYWEATEDGYAESGYQTPYDDGTKQSLDSNAVVASGSETTLTMAEFGDVQTRCFWFVCWNEWKTRNVNGAEITVAVWLEDGTKHTYSFAG